MCTASTMCVINNKIINSTVDAYLSASISLQQGNFFTDNGGEIRLKGYGHYGVWSPGHSGSRLPARHYARCIYCWSSNFVCYLL